MDRITITEGLAEIKTINARLVKRRENVMRYFARDARLVDPLAGADGGTVEFIKRERQAIGDLEKRVVTIRTAIQRVNLTATLTLHGQTRAVSDWLNWRRDVSAGAKKFLQDMANNVTKLRQETQRQGMRIVDAENAASAKPGEYIIGVNEKALADEMDQMEQLLGDLDGKLSLLNATTTIEV